MDKVDCTALQQLMAVMCGMNHHFGLSYFIKNISIAIGIILIWRGVWVLLDLLDHELFGGNHIITAIGGIIVGILILYLPDRNLKTLERL